MPPTCLTNIEPRDDGETGLRALGKWVNSALSWGLVFPLVVLHEACHIVAAVLMGSEIQGVGYSYHYVGSFRGRRLRTVDGFFVLHADDVSAPASVIISLAPAALAAPVLFIPGTLPGLLLMLAAGTVASDVYAMAADRFGLPYPGPESGIAYEFLVGSPDQWQETL